MKALISVLALGLSIAFSLNAWSGNQRQYQASDFARFDGCRISSDAFEYCERVNETHPEIDWKDVVNVKYLGIVDSSYRKFDADIPSGAAKVFVEDEGGIITFTDGTIREVKNPLLPPQ